MSWSPPRIAASTRRIGTPFTIAIGVTEQLAGAERRDQVSEVQ